MASPCNSTWICQYLFQRRWRESGHTTEIVAAKFHLPRHMTEAVFSTTSFHLYKHINEHPIPDHHHRPGESFILLKQLTLTPIRARFLTDRRLKTFLMEFSTQSCSTGYSVSYDPRFSKSWMSQWCIAVIFSGSTDVYPM